MKRIILIMISLIFIGCGIDKPVDPIPPPPAVIYLDHWYNSMWHFGPCDSITVVVHYRALGDRLYRWIPAPDSSHFPDPNQ